jgi:fructose-specific phosphotransferase system IIC component
MVALLSATVVALAVFAVLQQPLGFWPALVAGFLAGVLARAALLWVERLWLRAVVRRAQAQQAASSASPAKAPRS